MDLLYRLRRATAAEIQTEMPGKPAYSTVRAQLRVLEEKGHVRHIEEGTRFVYLPVVARESARRSALRHLLETFFDGSPEHAVTALLGGEAKRLSEDELERIALRIERARKESA
jgi:predicted transcriptional regulator